jgi:predicted ferric reductase
MSPDAAFQLANPLAMAGWLLLLVAPRARWTAPLVTGVVMPALFALAYGALLASQLGVLEGGFGSLDEVARLFENRWALLAGWLHYLAFDLFVGSWEVRDANRNGVHRGLVAPCLVLTFLLGPVGLLA